MMIPLRLTVQSLDPLTALHQQTIADMTDSCLQDWHMTRHDRSMSYLCDPPSTVQRHALTEYCALQKLDYAWLPSQLRLQDFRLLVMDMDSTLITIECLDEIADFCGRKAEVTAATEAAMSDPTIDFKISLINRVAWLQGLDEKVLGQVYTERLRLSPGAQTLLNIIQQHQIKTLLVSGGFTFFTDKLKAQLGLDFTQANILDIQQGKLTGKIVGDIIDGEAKAKAVKKVCAELGITTKQAIVIGDGSNDLKMMALSGLSVAFRAKYLVRTQAHIALNFVGLDGLLSILDQ